MNRSVTVAKAVGGAGLLVAAIVCLWKAGFIGMVWTIVGMLAMMAAFGLIGDATIQMVGQEIDKLSNKVEEKRATIKPEEVIEPKVVS